MYTDLVYSSPSVATAAAVVAQTFCDAKTDDDGNVGVPCDIQQQFRTEILVKILTTPRYSPARFVSEFRGKFLKFDRVEGRSIVRSVFEF